MSLRDKLFTRVQAIRQEPMRKHSVFWIFTAVFGSVAVVGLARLVKSGTFQQAKEDWRAARNHRGEGGRSTAGHFVQIQKARRGNGAASEIN